MDFIVKLFDNLSLENIKNELTRTAMGNRTMLLAKLDARVLILWYLVFALVPWFIYDRSVLLALAGFVAVVAAFSRVSWFILLLLFFGIGSEITCYWIVSYFFGGGLEAFLALMTLTLKLVTISLASVAIFTNMDPERLSDALLSMGVPGQITFAVSYGYRMIPVLIGEYHNIINSFRLRGKSPLKKGFLYWRQMYYMLKIMVYAFYPLVFNTAKRVRTTAEALEVRGFSYALQNKEARKLKLAYLRITPKDVIFLLGSISYIFLILHFA